MDRERDREFLNISDRDLVHYDRFRPFTAPERFRSLHDRKRNNRILGVNSCHAYN